MYEDQHYLVRVVRIDTPLAWLFASVGSSLDSILLNSAMPIRKHDPFKKQPYDDGFLFVKQQFNQLEVNKGARVTVDLAYPSLANCDDDAKQLDVVYRVYSISFSNSLARTLELGHRDEFSRAVVNTRSTRALSRFFFQPFVDYNRARGVFGGTQFTAKLANSLVKTIGIDVSGSSSTSFVHATAEGVREREKGPIRRTEWAGEYVRSDVPSNEVALKRGTGSGYFVATARPIGPNELVIRFGAALEGGNRQTNLTAASVLPDNLARSGYKSLKTFVGASLTPGRHSFKASYGMQFGSAGDGFQVDYIKQVFDGAADLRFIPWEPHHPVIVEARFSAGSISTRGRLPVGERFIGGNTEESFIEGVPWTIQSGPLIRSFPQNRFAHSDATSVLGGDRFFSANLTLGATVWARPLVPKDVVNYCAKPKPDAPGSEEVPDDDSCLTLDDVVDFELSGARSIIKGQYVAATPEFQAMANLVKGLETPLSNLKAELHLAAQMPDPGVQEALKELFQPPPPGADEPSGSYALVAKSVIKIISDLKDDKANRADVRTLAVGRQNKPGTSRIEKMNADLDTLVARLPGDIGSRITALRATFQQTGAVIKEKFVTLEKSDIDGIADKKAGRDMIYPTRLIKELIHETNLYSVSPVGFFDAARLWQTAKRPGDVRYAAGAGVRFTFVGLEVTGGYARTLHPRPWESRGAVVFSFALANLFR